MTFLFFDEQVSFFVDSLINIYIVASYYFHFFNNYFTFIELKSYILFFFNVGVVNTWLDGGNIFMKIDFFTILNNLLLNTPNISILLEYPELVLNLMHKNWFILLDLNYLNYLSLIQVPFKDFFIIICTITFKWVIALLFLFLLINWLSCLHLSISWTNNYLLAKFFFFNTSEEELGALDDFYFVVLLLLGTMCWYFFFFFNILFESFTSYSFTFSLFILFTFCVLAIPTAILWFFGLQFSFYVRGIGPRHYILIEVIFDLISTLIIFIRFVVQNIRFVFITWAYFELFHYGFFLNFSSLSNFYLINSDILSNINTVFFYKLFISLGWLVFSYLYYFLHLLALLYIQLGAYLLVSFWLFFFFYTSFFLTKNEKFFYYQQTFGKFYYCF